MPRLRPKFRVPPSIAWRAGCRRLPRGDQLLGAVPVTDNAGQHRLHRMATLLPLLIAAGVNLRAAGQCQPQWLPGEGIPGVNGTVYATTTWDPDGPGPQPELLVVGGLFTLAGATLANNIAAWDGV